MRVDGSGLAILGFAVQAYGGFHEISIMFFLPARLENMEQNFPSSQLLLSL